MACKFLRPRPPSSLGRQISCHVLRHKLFPVKLSLIPDHQKVLMIAVSSVICFFKNKILDMKYTGMEEKTDRMISIRAAWVIMLALKVGSLFLNLAMTKL